MAVLPSLLLGLPLTTAGVPRVGPAHADAQPVPELLQPLFCLLGPRSRESEALVEEGAQAWQWPLQIPALSQLFGVSER